MNIVDVKIGMIVVDKFARSIEEATNHESGLMLEGFGVVKGFRYNDNNEIVALVELCTGEVMIFYPFNFKPLEELK